MSNVTSIGGSGYKTVVTVPWAAGNEWLLAGHGGPRIGSPQSGYAIIPLLYRAVKLRVDSLARVPFYIYQNDKEVDAWPFEGSLKLKEFIRKTELAMMLRGGSFTVKLREESGIQVGLQWLNPFFVTVWLDGATFMFSYSIAGQTVPLQNRQWSQDDMIYWREFNPVNDIQPGIAPAQVALMDAQVSFNVSQFLEQFFAIGAMPATLVVVPEGTGKEEKAELESWFSRKVTGLKNAWKAIALKGEVKIEKLTPELKTFEIEKLDNHSIEAVCNAFDIPQTILRAGSANRATAETEYANYLQHTIIPRASWFEEQINDILKEDDQGYQVEFAPNELPEMQEDENKRSSSFKNYVDAGIPIPVAAEIVKVPIPDAYRNQLMKGEPKNPIEMIEPEVKAELERYQVKAMKAVKDGRSALVEFRTDIVPGPIMDRLGFLLSDAKTAHDVNAVFKAVLLHGNGKH
jgi:HK97 family phage portal protein